jgi:carbon monoxide dehydrogenase subunit G
MNFEKDFVLNNPQQQVWEFMADPDRIARCIPGVESVEKIDNTHYRAKVKAVVSFVSATFGLNVEIIEQVPPRLLRSRMKGKDSGIGSSISAETTLALEPITEKQTRVKYGANFVFTGQVASLGRSIMQAKTEEQTALFVQNVKQAFGDQLTEVEKVEPVGLGRMMLLFTTRIFAMLREWKDRLAGTAKVAAKEGR